ncbi:MAG: phage holin family protein [Candidatus Heimdallarchaeota archaeon]|nr:phage holin family protein [Candidatus Heimdallarchaeota archaeon]
MKHNKLLILIIGLSLAFSLVNQVQAWPDASIFVDEASTAPLMDGTIDAGEWDTEEDVFSETVSALAFDEGTVDITYSIVILKDDDNAYFLIQFTLSPDSAYTGNASIGLALEAGKIAGMNSANDRKIIYNNVSSGQTDNYDLFYCDSACGGNDYNARDERPGRMDDNNDIVSSGYGEDGTTKFFEFAITLGGTGEQDTPMAEGTNLKLVINPFANLYNVSSIVGHGGLGSNGIEVTFTPKSFFPRPEGPMDGLSMAFTGLFSVVVIGMSLALIITARNDKLAEKFLRVEITEEMKNKSVIMEIGYYNSGFIALFSLLYFWILALAQVLYGWWANWGLIGFLINFPALALSTFAGYDQIKRNHNPQDLPEEERRKLGKDVEKTNGLWIFPPAFLGLVLFMLVFIGIDVIS